MSAIKRFFIFLFSFNGTMKPSTYLKSYFFLIISPIISVACIDLLIGPFSKEIAKSFSVFVISIIYVLSTLCYLAWTTRFLRGQNQSLWWLLLYIPIPLSLLTAPVAFYKQEYQNTRNLNPPYSRPVGVTIIAYLLLLTSLYFCLKNNPQQINLWIFILIPLVSGIGLLKQQNFSRILVFLTIITSIIYDIYSGSSLTNLAWMFSLDVVVLFFLFKKNANLYFTDKNKWLNI